MKILYISLLFSLVVTGCSQIVGSGNIKEETRDLSGFSSIRLSGSVDVEITTGEQFGVKAEDDENLLPYLITSVEDGVLIIHYKDNVNIMNGHGKVYVTMPVVSKIETLGSGDVTSDGILKNTELILIRSSGSGDVNVSVNAPEVSVSGSGSGDFTLRGMTRKLDCRISGSGDIDASGLKCEQVVIKSSGSSDAKVFASVRLETHISGSGDVVYFGSPGETDIHTSGSGSVKSGN